MAGAMASPFSLLVNKAIPDLFCGLATTKHLNAPLSPQCQRVSRVLFWVVSFCAGCPVGPGRSIPQPRPQKRFLESSFGTRSVQLVHSGSTPTWGVCNSWRVAALRAGAVGPGGAESGDA